MIAARRLILALAVCWLAAAAFLVATIWTLTRPC